jgi:hypothetical protein
MSRELKDFVQGFSAGFKLMDDADFNKTRKAYYDELIEASKQRRQLLADKAAKAALPKEPSEYDRVRSKYLRDPGVPLGLQKRSDVNPNTALALNSAVPVPPVRPQEDDQEQPQQPGDSDDYETATPTDILPTAIPTDILPTASRGGMIPAPRYALGGQATAVPSAIPPTTASDDSEDEDETTNETDRADDDTGDEEEKGTVPVGDALRGGMSYLQSAFKLGPQDQAVDTPDPDLKNRQMALVKGLGAASDSAYDEVANAVDPKGRLSDAQRHILAIRNTYDYFAAKGDLKSAKKAASELIQYGRVKSAELAIDILNEPDPQKRGELAKKMYGWIPDGNDVDIQMNQDGSGKFSVVGPTGKVLNEGQFTPQQFMAAATNMKYGVGYWNELYRLAGQKPDKPEGETSATHQRLMGDLSDLGDNEEPRKADPRDLGKLSTSERTNYLSAYQQAHQKWAEQDRKNTADKKVKDKEDKDAKDAAAAKTATAALRRDQGEAADLAKELSAAPDPPEANKNRGKDLQAWRDKWDAKNKRYSELYWKIKNNLEDNGESPGNVVKIMESEGLELRPTLGRSAFQGQATQPAQAVPAGNPVGNPPAPSQAIPTTPAPAPAPAAAPAPAPQQQQPAAQPSPAPMQQPQQNQQSAPQLKPLTPDVAAKAKAAIQQGADPAKVKAYLLQNGYSTEGF